ncbi:MAG TPA: FHA domain-containing protein [Candidatus Polarisedimenticolia bacterium]|nr:FHA domain-containing protein [Candidatus Polarisedimenticolia bacterium]
MTKLRGGEQTVRMRAVPAGGVVSREAPLDPLPHGMTLTLEATEGPARGRTFHLSGRLTVLGREEGDIRLEDPSISRRHATLEVLDMETIILRDLSSTNGTYHNDQLIAFCKVADGDEIRLGSTALVVGVERLG